MPLSSETTSLLLLRSLTTTVTSQAPSELLLILPRLPSTLPPIASLLQTPPVPGSQAAALLHKLVSRISSLVSDARSQESRLAGTFLAKGIISSSSANLSGVLNAELLSKWIRALITIISRRNDLFFGRALAAVAAFTAFDKVHGKENERAVVGTLLPLFWGATVDLLGGIDLSEGITLEEKDLLSMVLSIWNALLLEWNPGTARPFSGRISTILSRYILIPGISKDSFSSLDNAISSAAAKAYVSLHAIGKTIERDDGLLKTIQTLKAVLDPVTSSISQKSPLDSSSIPDSKIICQLLRLTKAYISTPTPKTSQTSIKIPLGLSLGVCSQLSQLDMEDIQTIGQLSIEKGGSFAFELPLLHLEVLGLLTCLVVRLDTLLLSSLPQILEDLTSIFKTNISNAVVRRHCYVLLARVLPLVGDLSIRGAKSLELVIQTCCNDTLPQEGIQSIESNGAQGINQAGGSISATPNIKVNFSAPLSSQGIEAAKLLPLLLRYIQSPRSIRRTLERTAILSDNVEALVFATMNPMADGTPSLLPFAARAVRRIPPPGLEALIRPRVPVIRTGDTDLENIEEVGQPEDEKDSEGMRNSLDVDMDLDHQPSYLSSDVKKTGNVEDRPFQPLVINFPDSFSSKRSIEGPLNHITSPKRARFDELPSMNTISERTESGSNRTSYPLDLTADHLATPKHIQDKVNESSDDDAGSDFEIPPLVLASTED